MTDTTGSSPQPTVQPTVQPSTPPSAPPTPTSQPEPTASASPSPSGSLPPVGVEIFSDNFEGPVKYLSRGVQEDFGGSEYVDGVYRVTAEPRPGFVNYQGGGSRSGCSGTDCEFADEIHGDILTATVEVDATQISGAADGGFGIGCAFEGMGTLGRFVGLTISSDGRRYAVAVNSAPGDVPLDQLIGGSDRGEPHPSLEPGLGVTHHLRADCGEQVFSFWVDGQLITSGSLPEPFGEPDFERGIGLVVAPGVSEAVEVEFDNLVVSELVAEPAETPQSGLPIFIDPLSSESATWPVGEYAAGSAAFEGGAYVVSPTLNQRAFVSPTTMVPPADVTVQVDLVFDSGHELMSGGVVCRASSAGWYAGEIRFDGMFSISREGLLGTTRLVDWTPSTAIQPEDAVNTVRLQCVGETVTFFVNDEQVGQATDSIVADPGGAGVQATSPQEATGDDDVVVEFNNYQVTHPL